ncbi:MAG: hypothetical protein AAGF79_10625 [Pseudomonadota bacterium]
MRALIHIGTPKAGSTTIQYFVNENAEALASKGVQYLRHHDGYRGNHELLHAGLLLSGDDLTEKGPRSLLKSTQPRDVAAQVDALRASLEALVAKRGGSGTYFASNELIFLRLTTAPRIAGLHDLLSEYFSEVRYLCYLRPPEDWILSRYSQHLRGGGTSTLEEYGRQQSESYDFANILDTWADCVGQDNQIVRLLDRDSLVGGDLIADVLSLMGLDSDGFAPVPRQNEALGHVTCSFLRQINETLGRADLKDPNEIIRRALVKRLEQGSDGEPRPQFSSETVGRIRSENAEQLERIRARYFPDRATLFAPPRLSAPQEAPDFSEAVALAASLLSELPRDEKLASRLRRANPPAPGPRVRALKEAQTT